MVASSKVYFNVNTATPKGVYPPVPHASADSYDLLMTENTGPRSIPFDHVNTHDETILMVSGSYSTRIGTERVTVNQGDVLIIRKGVSHGDIQTGPEGYRALQIESNVG